MFVTVACLLDDELAVVARVVCADIIADVVGLIATLVDVWLDIPAVVVKEVLPPVVDVGAAWVLVD